MEWRTKEERRDARGRKEGGTEGGKLQKKPQAPPPPPSLVNRALPPCIPASDRGLRGAVQEEADAGGGCHSLTHSSDIEKEGRKSDE